MISIKERNGGWLISGQSATHRWYKIFTKENRLHAMALRKAARQDDHKEIQRLLLEERNEATSKTTI
jgi:hypothetical protein